MNIGQASQNSGLPVKTIRYYEEIGLVKADRNSNNYRDYSRGHLNKLKFLQRARSLGFSIEECRQLLSLYEDENRASAKVKTIAEGKIKVIENKISELESMRATLSYLAANCNGNDRPDCPILNDLTG